MITKRHLRLIVGGEQLDLTREITPPLTIVSELPARLSVVPIAGAAAMSGTKPPEANKPHEDTGYRGAEGKELVDKTRRLQLWDTVISTDLAFQEEAETSLKPKPDALWEAGFNTGLELLYASFTHDNMSKKVYGSIIDIVDVANIFSENEKADTRQAFLIMADYGLSILDTAIMHTQQPTYTKGEAARQTLGATHNIRSEAFEQRTAPAFDNFMKALIKLLQDFEESGNTEVTARGNIEKLRDHIGKRVNPGSKKQRENAYKRLRGKQVANRRPTPGTPPLDTAS